MSSPLRSSWRRVLLVAVFATHCARTVGNGPVWDDAGALDARSDGARESAAPARDGAAAEGGPGLDGDEPPWPPEDRDVVIPPPVDVPTLPDGAVDPRASIAGMWRLVRFEFAGDDDRPRVLSDVNGPFEVNDAFEIEARVNGTLFVDARRVAYTVAILMNDHLFANDEAPDAASALSTYGFSARATLEGDRVQFFGGNALAFRRNADGTLSYTDPESSSVTTWERAALAPQPEAYFAGRGRAFWFGGEAAGPPPTLQRPRVTLAWDTPNSRALHFTSDVPMTRSPLGYFEYPVVVRGAPPVFEALERDPAGARVAVAYVLAYEDRDGSGAYEAERDTLRGVSPVGVAWRVGPANASLAASPLRNCTTGYQLVSLHGDFSTGRRTAEPYDTARPVSLDVALAREAFTGELPELLR